MDIAATITQYSTQLNQYSVIYVSLIVITLVVMLFLMHKKESLSSGHHPLHWVNEHMTAQREAPSVGPVPSSALLRQNAKYFNQSCGPSPYIKPSAQDLHNLGIADGHESFDTGSCSEKQNWLPDPSVYAYAYKDQPGVITVDSIVSGGGKLRNKSERSDAEWDWDNQYGGPGESGWRRRQEDYQYENPYYYSGGDQSNYLPYSEKYLYQAALGY